MTEINLRDLLIAFIPVFAGGITQLVKFTLYSFRHGLQWNYLMTHGHMPSTHSAFAVAMLISVMHLNGIDSGIFAVALAVAVIIIDDALRLRMYLGDQGRYLNMMIQTLDLNPQKYPRLKERVGHRTSEVIVGLIFGALLAWIFIAIIEKQFASLS
jgi:acid phosphatase family membrane protein YuiD